MIELQKLTFINIVKKVTDPFKSGSLFDGRNVIFEKKNLPLSANLLGFFSYIFLEACFGAYFGYAYFLFKN